MGLSETKEVMRGLRESAEEIGKMLSEAHSVLDEITGAIPNTVGLQVEPRPDALITQLEIELQNNCALVSNLCNRLNELRNRI